ncbi:hypothetical protein ACIA8F_08460 [Streptomyces sp. NPDC051563]|uniref:hypothetical protein n=1 Tax=Streptomyces sp. NPDC051563 TaxID=3365659 RepID=UPI0037B31AA2
MLHLTTTPLGGGSVVRGVLPLRPHRHLVRVVVGDGAAPTAYDLPLLDRNGNELPAAGLPAAVRQLVRHASDDRNPTLDEPSDETDPYCVQVFDVTHWTGGRRKLRGGHSAAPWGFQPSRA